MSRTASISMIIAVPLLSEVVSARVRELRADVGLALDGDADRLIVLTRAWRRPGWRSARWPAAPRP